MPFKKATRLNLTGIAQSEPKMDYRLRPRMFRADSGRPLCNLHDPLLRFCAPTTLRRIARAANAADVLHSRHSPSLRGERRHRTIPSPRGVISGTKWLCCAG